MNLIEKIFPFLFSLIILCQSCTNSFTQKKEKEKVRKEIHVSEFLDPMENSEEKFDSINVVFDVGFDEIQCFRIFLDAKQIMVFSGKTNYSVGLCLLENYSLCSFTIPQKEIKSNSKLLVEINNEYVELEFPKKTHLYTHLYIGRCEKWWEASFQVDKKSREFE